MTTSTYQPIARLDGKVAVIIGGAGAIGQAAARHFAALGAKVALVHRSDDPARMQAILQTLTGSGHRAYVASVTDSASLKTVAANIQAAVPKARVAAAFHHVPAKELGDIHEPVESDVLVCSDHRSATEVAAEIVAALPDLRPLDAGQLSNAAPIEAFAAVLLQLNIRYKTRAAVKFTGIA